MEHREAKVWSGDYLDIPYEIRNWHFSDGKPVWNYYIFLREEQLPEMKIWLRGRKLSFGGIVSRHISYEYEKSQISNLDWHGGCTYYEKVSGFDGSKKVVKAGCDYAHFFDENIQYSILDVEEDVKRTIRKLHETTRVLNRCSYCGNFVETVNEKRHCENCANK